MSSEWQQSAACIGADPELFFPINEDARNPVDAERVRQAKAICGGCPVRNQCLESAFANRDHHGVWGGLTSGERDRLTRTKSGAEREPTPDTVMVDRIRRGDRVTAGTHDRRRLIGIVMHDTPVPLIAQAFGIAPRTVETDKRILRTALGLVKTVDPDKCGTQSNYAAHRRLREPPCPACCHAHALDAANRRRKRRRQRELDREAVPA